MVNVLKNLPAPHSNWVTVLQILYPVKHELDALVVLGFKSWSAKMFSYIFQHAVVFGHVKDEENAHKVLRPAE